MPPQQNKTSEKKHITLDEIFSKSIEENASDVHIEPLEKSMMVRFRIDGKLQEKWNLPLIELEPILNRIKVLSNMDIADHSKPQDGHFELVIKEKKKIVEDKTPSKETDDAPEKWTEDSKKSANYNKLMSLLTNKKKEKLAPEKPNSQKEKIIEKERTLNVRSSIFPTVDGDAAVLRLLDRSEMLITLDNLGIDKTDLQTIRRLVSRTYGMLLLTGPAGSGKTTTLYSVLRELRDKEKNIVTLEDPVEYDFADIRQSQINENQGFTFARGMKSILRQDPDVIMIGEVRDPETAENAVRAALTGKSVFSTIHSNNTVGTIARLLDMDVQCSLIAYAINGILSQRLIRKVCPHCLEKYTPTPDYLGYFGLSTANFTFKKGKGCDNCRGTGFTGRTGIFEILEFNNDIRSMIVEKKSMKDIQLYAESAGMKTLKQKALEKVMQGVTTIEEVASVV